jgi:Predicted membrane protein
MMYIKKLVILILISLTLLASGCEEIMNFKQSSKSLQEPSTEFYILGPDGTAKNYPTDYVLGENGTVIVGIINHEQKPVNYTMEIRLEDTPLPLPDDRKNIYIRNNETWKKAVTITPPFEGTNMSLQFLLYNNDKKEMLENISVPYRDLHLWINVTTQNLSKNTSTPITAI